MRVSPAAGVSSEGTFAVPFRLDSAAVLGHPLLCIPASSDNKALLILKMPLQSPRTQWREPGAALWRLPAAALGACIESLWCTRAPALSCGTSGKPLNLPNNLQKTILFDPTELFSWRSP